MNRLLVMPHSLEKTEVVSSVLPEYLRAAVDPLPRSVNGSLKNQPEPLRKLAEHLGAQVGIRIGMQNVVIARNNPVQPLQYQGETEDKQSKFVASDWHLDTNREVIVASALTPEIPVATTDALHELEKVTGEKFFPRYIGIETKEMTERRMRRIADAMNEVGDRILQECGISIWSADPFEITPVGALQIHRAAINLSELPVDRTSLVVSEAVVRPQGPEDFIR